MKQYSFLLVGGDKRQVELFNLLKSKGENAESIFLKTDNSIEEALKKIDFADVIVMPIPSSIDKETLFAPYTENKIPLSKLTERFNENQILFIGGENPAFLASKPNKKINLLEYEPMTLKGAMATSEAALAILINNTDITIFGANILVIGYGRIGKIISDYLNALKANVTVCARKNTAKTLAELSGNKSIGFDLLEKEIIKADIIVNTVPSMILDEQKLKLVSIKTLILDLASKPGGVDFKAAEKLNIKAIHALSLPGKYSPVSAAGFIEEAINNILT